MRLLLLVGLTALLACGGDRKKTAPVPGPAPAPAVVVLVQGDLAWMGTETYEEGPDALPGAFAGLPGALDALAAGLPEGSRAALVTYAGNGPVVRQPLGAPADLRAALGEQRDYNDIGVPLESALQQAYTLLAESGAERRELVIIGEGIGRSEDITDALEREIDRLQTLKARVHTIYHPATDYGAAGAPNMKLLGYTSAYTAASRDDLAGHAAAIAKAIASNGG